MCLVVYLASSMELSQLAWDEHHPSIHLTDLSEGEDVIRKKFSLEHVYSLGSHQGCGCGFIKEGASDGIEKVQIQKDYDALGYLISAGVLKGFKYQIYTCWDGDQWKKHEDSKGLKLSEIIFPEFEFREKVLFEIT